MWYGHFIQAVDNHFYGIVVANKLDLVPDADVDEMRVWATDHKLGFITTSAKTGENVDVLFEMAVQGAFLAKNNRIFEKHAEPEQPSSGGWQCC
jgi:50S ribosomal subunit-associated GTPase HflX